METFFSGLNVLGEGFVELAWGMFWQSSVLILVLVGVDLVLRRRVRAVVRYGVWMLVLVKLVMPPGVTWPASLGYWVMPEVDARSAERVADVVEVQPLEAVSWPMAEGVGSVEVAGEGVVVAGDVGVERVEGSGDVVAAESIGGGGVAALRWQGVVFCVWAICVFAMLLLLVQRWRFVAGLVRRSEEAGASLGGLVEEARARLGLRGRVRVRVSSYGSSPCVCGLWRPVVLIPRPVAEGLSVEQLRAVVLHELGHVKRGDLWVSFVQTILQVGYWWHPLVWWANGAIRRVREQAVDETVQVAMADEAGVYPGTLLEVSRLMSGRGLLGLRVIGVVESKAALKERIRRMVMRPVPRSARLGAGALGVVLVLAAVLLPMAGGQERSGALPQASPVALSAGPSADPDTINEQFDACTSSVVEAFNEIDAEAIVGLYAPDGVLLPHRSGLVAGRQELRGYYGRQLREASGVRIASVRSDRREFWLAGDLVVALDECRMYLRVAGAAVPIAQHVKNVSVFRVGADGVLQVLACADSPSSASRSGGGGADPNVAVHAITTDELSREQLGETIATVKELDREFHDCFLRRDAAAAVAYYAEDGQLVPLGEGVVRGREALLAHIREGMNEAELVEHNQRIVRAGGNGSLVYIVNEFTWQFRNAASPEQVYSVPGKGIHVWQKQSDGGWRLFLDTYNVSVAMP